MLYRILTENKNLNQIEKQLRAEFEGFTIYKGEGHWRLQKENSLIIEIETTDIEKINRVAKDIKISNNQEAVMVQQIQNHSWLI